MDYFFVYWICSTFWLITCPNYYDCLFTQLQWLERSFGLSFPHSWLIIVFVNKNNTTVVVLKQELLTRPGHLYSHHCILWGSCWSVFSFCVVFCSLLFVLLSFFFWQLSFNLQLLITAFTTSNLSSLNI